MGRNEEDKILQTGIQVTLGGKEYEIRPLVIRESREWRKKVIGLIAPLPQMVKVDTDNPEEFEKVLATLLVVMPDQAIDLFFNYAKDLNREEIEGSANDAEMAEAFEEVMKVAFPLAQSLPNVMKRLSQ